MSEKDVAAQQAAELENKVGWGRGAGQHWAGWGACQWEGACSGADSDGLHALALPPPMLLPPQVAVLEQEVQEARSKGTPHGEGAKRVSRLALEKIKALQEEEQQLRADYEGRLAAAAKERDEAQVSRLAAARPRLCG